MVVCVHVFEVNKEKNALWRFMIRENCIFMHRPFTKAVYCSFEIKPML